MNYRDKHLLEYSSSMWFHLLSSSFPLKKQCRISSASLMSVVHIVENFLNKKEYFICDRCLSLIFIDNISYWLFLDRKIFY